MASSKVMASTSPANSDLPRQSSIHTFTVCDFQADPANRSFGSMNMDELLKNMYADSDSFPSNNGAPDGGGGSGRCPAADCAGNSGGLHAQRNNGNKMDDVWKEMVTGSAGDNRGDEEMTLEDYLTKAGAVREEDVRPRVIPPPGYGVESMMNVAQFQVPGHMQSGQNGPGGYGVEPVGFGNGIDGTVVAVGASGGSAARGKRRLVDEQPLDRATQQKQRRMIKNRESAARSRERKQAYTIELESLVTQLEEENARLLREEAELIRERYQQLMDNLIPIIEEKRPPRVLRRVCSMGW